MHTETLSLKIRVKIPDSDIFTLHFRIRCFPNVFFQNTSTPFSMAYGVAHCCVYRTNRSLLKMELLGFLVDFPVIFVTIVFGCFAKAVC